MRIAFVADINSPIARNWMSYFTDVGDEVHVISLYHLTTPPLQGTHLSVVPLFMSSAMGLSKPAQVVGRVQLTRNPRRSTRQILRALVIAMRLPVLWSGYVAPLDTFRLRKPIQRLVDAIGPDIVHGLRLPMEGEALADLRGFPVLLSIWGNDLTLFAGTYWPHRHSIGRVLRQAEGLMADCTRDIQLAGHFGYRAGKPSLVVPGAGGISSALRASPSQAEEWRQRLAIAPGAPVVLNPRGVRQYVRNFEYFHAIPQVLRVCPDAVFVSVGVEGDLAIARTVENLGIGQSVRLLPKVSQVDLAALFRLSSVMVSPSIHDGTPNTLLEGMANGAVPLAGDIESVREWIAPGENGLLFDARDSAQLGGAIIRALGDPAWMEAARQQNRQIVDQRADYSICMARARDFYKGILEGAR
jgi:glycosyltransferase involved in cell wall biosynthesis